MSVLQDSYSETNRDDFTEARTARFAGQAFTTLNDGTSYSLSSAKFNVRKIGIPSGSFRAKLYAHSGTYGTSSIATGSALATSDDISANGLTTSYVTTELTFSTPYTMAPNTHYIITCEGDGADASNCVLVGTDSSSPSHGGNFTQGIAGVWTAFNTIDLCFYVYGIGSSSNGFFALF